MRERFPLAWDFNYRILGKRAVIGRGRSINISSSGALVTTQHAVSPGTRIQMNIAWPISHDGIPLELTIEGRVLRNEQGKFAVQFLVSPQGPRVVRNSSDEAS